MLTEHHDELLKKLHVMYAKMQSFQQNGNLERILAYGPHYVMLE